MTLLRVRRGGALVAPVLGGGGTPPPTVGGFSLYGPEAGGYLTGLNVADNGVMYARADVGGAYRKEPGTGSAWTQLITLSGVPTPRFDDFYVDAIACSPTQPQHVYAAVGFGFDGQGRVMRSTTSGLTWTVPGSKRFAIHGNAEYRYGREPLAVQHDKPEVVYYGTRREGLWRSLDGAVTWAQVTSLPAPPASTDYHRNDVTVILIERASSTGTVAGVTGVRLGLWACVRGRGVYRSADGGATWSLLHSIASTAFVRDAMLDASGRLVAAIFDPSGTDSAVRITSAGALTTFTLAGGSSFSTVAAHPTDPLRLVFGNDGLRPIANTPSMWRTTNGGTSWTQVDQAINNGADGAVWPTQSDILGFMSTGQIRFDPSDTNRLWFAEGMGAWHVVDSASTNWTFASRGVQELVANAIVKPPGTGAVAVTWDRGVWKHNGTAWTLPASAQAGVFCSAWDVQQRPDSPLVLAATVSDHQSDDTNAAKRLSCISTDGGVTWTRLAGLTAGTTTQGLRFGTIAIARGSTDRLVWAPSFSDNANDLTGVPLSYSTDRGSTWLTPTITPALPAGARVSDYNFNKQRKVVASQVTTDKFYALAFSSNNTYLLVSTNGGASWTSSLIDATGSGAGQFSAHLTAVKVGAAEQLFWTTGPRGDGLAATQATGQLPIRKSTDGGATWTTVPQVTGGHCLGVGAQINPSTNPTLFTYGWKAGVRGLYYSTDLGTTWTLTVNEPLGWHQGVSALAGDPEVPGRVYVGMPGGSYFVGQV